MKDLTPEQYRTLRTVIIMMLLVTAFSQWAEFSKSERDAERAHAIEMSKRNFCLRTVLGNEALTYQPCEMVIGRQ